MFDLLASGGSTSIIILIAVVTLVAVVVVIKIMRSRHKGGFNPVVNAPIEKAIREETKVQISEAPPDSNCVLGTGNYKCMAYRYDGSLDFTTMPEPIGELYSFDTSCPFSGAGYIVKELKTGEIVDYDPREMPIEPKATPEWAWFAINPRDVTKRFWTVPTPFWKSGSMWFAAAMIVVLFISFLSVFGG